MRKRLIALICLLLLLAGCRRQADPLPTLASVEGAATAVVLTENAPPAGYDAVAFPQIDDNLTALPGWHYTAIVQFDGVVARTTREISTRTQADVYYNQVASARRVVAEVRNDLQNQPEPIQYEAVQLGPDAFLVREGVCLSNAGDDAQTAANLSAGSLIGGVRQANTAAQKGVINSEAVWRYAFEADDLLLPSVTFNESSRLLEMRGELWVAPEHNAVIRYHLNLEVENVVLFGASLPVTGTLIMRYDLYDVGTAANLSVPFGC